MQFRSRPLNFSPPCWKLIALYLMLSTGGVLLASCASRPALELSLAPRPNGPPASVVIPAAGRTRVAVTRPPAVTEPVGFSLQAVGDRPVRDINLAAGTHGLLAPAEATPALFNLLPRERCGFTAEVSSASLMRGLFLWELPANADVLRGATRRLAEAAWNTTEGLVLARRGLPTIMEFDLTAPFPHERASVAWEVSPALEPEVWVSLDGEAWGRISLRGRRAGAEAGGGIDLAPEVRGQTRFLIRLVFDPPANAPINARYQLRALRLEREVAGPAQLRRWDPGENRLEIETGNASGPLVVELLGGE